MRLWWLSISVLVGTVTTAQALVVGGFDLMPAHTQDVPALEAPTLESGEALYSLKSSFPLSAAMASEWQIQPYRPSANYRMNLRFSLRPRPNNVRILEDTLLSNRPGNPSWTRQKHLSKDDVARLGGPHPDAVKRFHAFLAAHGLSTDSVVYTEHDTMRAKAILPNVSVQLAERLLRTRYAVYKHQITGREIVRTTEYSLPNGLLDDIEWVQPTNYFGNVEAHRRTSHVEPSSGPLGEELSAADGVTYSTPVTLEFVKDLYNLTNYTPSAKAATSGLKLGISG